MSPHPRRTDRSAPADTDTRYLLATQDQCLGFAHNLGIDFEQAHVAALTGAGGLVLDGIVLTDPSHRPDHAVGFALCLALEQRAQAELDEVLDLTLFSVLPRLGAEPARPVQAAHRRAETIFDGLARVRDWIVTDGSATHSLACVSDPHGTWARGFVQVCPEAGDGEVVLLC